MPRGGGEGGGAVAAVVAQAPKSAIRSGPIETARCGGPGDHSHDFLVTVFQNSGSAIKLLDDPDAALRHLLASHPLAHRDPSGSWSLI